MKVFVRYSCLLFISLVLTLAPAVGADWSFNPVIGFGVEQTDNAFSLQTDSSDPDFDPADVSFYVSTALVWSAQTPRAIFSFSYTPFFERYQDHTELDNTAHRALMRWDYQTSTRTTWSTGWNWGRQQRQRVRFDSPDQDQIVLPQTEFDTFGANVEGRFLITERSRLVFVAGGGMTDYSENEIPPTDLDGDGTIDTPEVSLDDASDIYTQLGWETDVSERATAGVSVYATRIDEGSRGEYDVYRLLGVYRWGHAERLTTTITLGGAQTSVRDAGEGVSEDLPSEPSYLVGSLGVEGTIGRRTTLRGGIFRDVQSSGGVTGSALTSGAFIAMATPTGRWSTLNLFARLANRDPIEDALSVRATDTLSYRAEWAAGLSSRWHLVLAGERFDQDSESELLVGEYTVWSAGMRWTPNAPRR